MPYRCIIPASSFLEGEVVNLVTLREKGMLSQKETPTIKILGNGELTKHVVFEVHSVSKSAEEKILRAKGEIKILS